MPSYAITGASRGIGYEFVNQLSADSNNTVFAIVRNPQGATSENLRRLSETRKNVFIVKADLEEPKSWKAAANEVASKSGGKLDVFIQNAANLDFEKDEMALSLDEYESEEKLTERLLAQFIPNVIGAIHATNAFVPLVQRGSVKKIVNISSAAGNTKVALRLGLKGRAAYSIAKAGLNMASVNYAIEYKDDGIAFLSLCPGFVDTFSTKSEGTLDADHWAWIQPMQERFKKVHGADWDGLPISPETSVKMCLDAIHNKLSIETSGAIWSQYGTDEKWHGYVKD